MLPCPPFGVIDVKFSLLTVTCLVWSEILFFFASTYKCIVVSFPWSWIVGLFGVYTTVLQKRKKYEESKTRRCQHMNNWICIH